MASQESVSRRDFVQAASVAGVAGLATVSTGLAADAPASTTQEPVAALAQLLEGNKRYMRGELAHPRRKPEDFAVLPRAKFPLPLSSAARMRALLLNSSSIKVLAIFSSSGLLAMSSAVAELP